MMSHLVLGLFEMNQTYSFSFLVVDFHFFSRVVLLSRPDCGVFFFKNAHGCL